MEYTTKNNLKIKLVEESIFNQDVDVIVNAANRSLIAGGGLCGKFFARAGEYELSKECSKFGPINNGEAVITKGYKLKQPFIIHTPGPNYDEVPHDIAPIQLRNSYINSLKLADEKGLTSIAFPSISTGIFHYPKDKASRVAINAFLEYVPNNIKEVRMCLGNDTYPYYEEALKELTI